MSRLLIVIGAVVLCAVIAYGLHQLNQNVTLKRVDKREDTEE